MLQESTPEPSDVDAAFPLLPTTYEFLPICIDFVELHFFLLVLLLDLLPDKR